MSYKNAVVPPAQALSKRATYSGCTSARQTSIASAISSGASYASSSYSFLTSNPSTSTRYVRWFGTWTSSRYNLVLNSFSVCAWRITLLELTDYAIVRTCSACARILLAGLMTAVPAQTQIHTPTYTQADMEPSTSVDTSGL